MGRNDPNPDFAWSVRPVAAEKGKGIGAGAVVLLATYGAFRWGGPLVGAVGGILLAGGIGSFFVKTAYRLSPDGVSVRSPFKRVDLPWTRVRRIYVGPRGITLSPFSGHHLLEPYRSVMLAYGPHRERILECVGRLAPAVPGRPGAPEPGEGA
jgi:hypothetical protein